MSKTVQVKLTKNKLDGSTAFKAVDGDNNTIIQIFHEDRRQEVMAYLKSLGKYGSIQEDCDRDIICFEQAETDEWD